MNSFGLPPFMYVSCTRRIRTEEPATATREFADVFRTSSPTSCSSYPSREMTSVSLACSRGVFYIYYGRYFRARRNKSVGTPRSVVNDFVWQSAFFHSSLPNPPPKHNVVYYYYYAKTTFRTNANSTRRRL